MKNGISTPRNTVSARSTHKKIGRQKAEKFSSVEGMALSAKSRENYGRWKSSGLTGDALRTAINSSFKKK